ncbi:MAG: hypothetical protein AMXMBFR33_24250 [Candidatus Xenobia bacterium]
MSRRCFERALAAGGPESAEALSPCRAVEPSLLQFYADQALDWLVRELPGREWNARIRTHRITLEGGSRGYQLRLTPDRCRWLLLVGTPRRWTVPPLAGLSLSLVDWLRQIRQLESRQAGSRDFRTEPSLCLG